MLAVQGNYHLQASVHYCVKPEGHIGFVRSLSYCQLETDDSSLFQFLCHSTLQLTILVSGSLTITVGTASASPKARDRQDIVRSEPQSLVCTLHHYTVDLPESHTRFPLASLRIAPPSQARTSGTTPNLPFPPDLQFCIFAVTWTSSSSAFLQ